MASSSNKKISNDTMQLIISIVILVLGVILITSPDQAMSGITIVIGIILLAYGGISVAIGINKKDKGESVSLVLPIVAIVAGILLLVFNNLFANTILPFIIGAWAVITGVINLVTAGQIKVVAPTQCRMVMFTGLVALVVGLIILIGVFVSGENAFGILIGICMVIYSAVSIFSWFASSSGKKLLGK